MLISKTIIIDEWLEFKQEAEGKCFDDSVLVTLFFTHEICIEIKKTRQTLEDAREDLKEIARGLGRSL